jgi:hypothetical protein
MLTAWYLCRLPIPRTAAFDRSVSELAALGIILEAAFPVASKSLHGDLDVTARNNDIEQSCQNPLLVSFSRHTTGLGLTNQPYLRNSTYTMRFDNDTSLGVRNMWYAHPAGFGNTLIVNGVVVPNGTRQSYDATRVCG